MKWTRNLRLKHFRILTELADTGSLTDTARLTHTTQPALSKWLRELEEQIGAPLFERHARGLKPTNTGELLIGHARRLISEAERIEQNIETSVNGGVRVIQIGTSPAAAPNFIPSTILGFLDQHPGVNINLREDSMNVLLEQLELGKLDLVVGRIDDYQPRQKLSSALLYHERLMLVCRPDHPLTREANPSWEQIYQYDWIMWPPGTPVRAKLDNAFMAAGLKPVPMRVESTSQIANLWMIKNSDMLSVISQSVARHFTDRGLLVPLNVRIEESVGSIGMCWPDDLNSDPLMKQLIERFREYGQRFNEEYQSDI